MQPGLAPPWATLDPASRTGLSLALVTSALDQRGHLFRDATSLRWPDECVAGGVDAVDGPEPGGDGGDAAALLTRQRSAVLVALYELDAEARVVLTRRSLSLRHHRGEVAFPGGRCDEGEDALATALREAEEEIGLASSLVTPIGWLSPLVSYVAGSSIWPVVATLSSPPTLRANPDEVDRVFSVALRDLLVEGAFVEEWWRHEPRRSRTRADGDGYAPVYFYRVPGEVMWGATARVVTELLCLVTGSPWPRARGRDVERP